MVHIAFLATAFNAMLNTLEEAPLPQRSPCLQIYDNFANYEMPPGKLNYALFMIPLCISEDVLNLLMLGKNLFSVSSRTRFVFHLEIPVSSNEKGRSSGGPHTGEKKYMPSKIVLAQAALLVL